MKPGRGSSLSLFVEMVRKYQRQIVLSIDTESTLVPLAEMGEFPRLSEHPRLDDGGVRERREN
jgi:hypothetical protein